MASTLAEIPRAPWADWHRAPRQTQMFQLEFLTTIIYICIVSLTQKRSQGTLWREEEKVKGIKVTHCCTPTRTHIEFN